MLVLAAVAVGATVSTAAPALAHESADVQVTSPAEGARLDDSVDIVLTAVTTGGDIGFANFTLSLDGRAVDQNGRVGSAFASLSVAAGESLTVPLRSVALGSHELRVTYTPDPDSAPKADVVRTFTVASAGSGSRSAGPAVAMGAAFLVLIGAAVALRRRAGRQVTPAAKPADRAKKPAAKPAGSAARSKPHPRKRSRR